jgi:hypothetical protein
MIRNIRRGGKYGIGSPPKDEEGRTVILTPPDKRWEVVDGWAVDQEDASSPVLAGEE